MMLGFLNIGGAEFLVIGLAFLLLFGTKGIPDLARGLARVIRQVRDAGDAVKREIARSADLEDESVREVKRQIEELKDSIERK